MNYPEVRKYRHTVLRLLVCALLLCTTVVCQHARVRFDDCRHCREDEGQAATQLFPQPFWAWGLVPWQMEYNLSEICPNGVKEVHEYAGWLDGLFDNGTAGIYSPRHLAITCNAPAQSGGDSK